jgi:quercetin dioxygenase-like cupin family protein
MIGMKLIRESEIAPGQIAGKKGTVSVYDVVTGVPQIGVRIVPANSDVPTRPHSHPEKQVLYVISGQGRITNGRQDLDIVAGDFVLLEENEEHYVITGLEELKVFEVKY